MFGFLESYLENTVTPERKELIEDAVNVLESLGHEAFLDELNSIFNLIDASTTTHTLSRIDAAIDSAQDSILQNHGVYLNEGLDLYNKNKLVKTIDDLDHYIFPDQIALIFQGDFDNEHIYLHLVNLMQDLDIDLVLPYVHEISDELVENLEKLINDQLLTRSEMIDYVAPVSKIKHINKVLRLIDSSKLSLAMEMVNYGKRIGDTLNNLIDSKFVYLDDMEYTELVYELFGLILISNVEIPQYFNVLETTINDYTDNLGLRKLMLDTMLELKTLLEPLTREDE